MRFENGCGSRKFARQGTDELGIRAMAGFDRDHVSPDWLPEQRKVADDIEDFVPNEFVRVNPLGLQITYFRVDQAFEEAGR